jgi:hypothetical protein
MRVIIYPVQFLRISLTDMIQCYGNALNSDIGNASAAIWPVGVIIVKDS